MSHEMPWSWDFLSLKNMSLSLPRFYVINTNDYQKNLFSTLWYLHKKFMYNIVPVIALESVRIVSHSYVASFSIKTRFYELND